ncbi:hypothetical protein [Embleya sp. NPDC020630]|uniref:hypothetical protein n=1 Tax=Embleya sp. NPDC020630 TaxID=3363979 RepID=UPI00378CA4BB
MTHDPRYTPLPGCTHCPDGHTPPDHGQPWGAWVGPERDGDGQPTTIHVARSAGAHVTESDAEWIRARLNSGRTPTPQAQPMTQAEWAEARAEYERGFPFGRSAG